MTSSRKVFPDGRTVHLPSNGQPLAGYELALADAERQGRSPSAITLAAARNVTTTPDSEERPSPSSQPGLIETLFGSRMTRRLRLRPRQSRPSSRARPQSLQLRPSLCRSIGRLARSRSRPMYQRRRRDRVRLAQSLSRSPSRLSPQVLDRLWPMLHPRPC